MNNNPCPHEIWKQLTVEEFADNAKHVASNVGIPVAEAMENFKNGALPVLTDAKILSDGFNDPDDDMPPVFDQEYQEAMEWLTLIARSYAQAKMLRKKDPVNFKYWAISLSMAASDLFNKFPEQENL